MDLALFQLSGVMERADDVAGGLLFAHDSDHCLRWHQDSGLDASRGLTYELCVVPPVVHSWLPEFLLEPCVAFDLH